MAEVDTKENITNDNIEPKVQERSIPASPTLVGQTTLSAPGGVASATQGGRYVTSLQQGVVHKRPAATTTTAGITSQFYSGTPHYAGGSSVYSGNHSVIGGGNMYSSSTGGMYTSGGFDSGAIHSGAIHSAGAQHRYTGSRVGSQLTEFQGSSSHTEQMIREGHIKVISEQIVEHEVRVPKRVVWEDVVEKVVIVPEKVCHEDVIEESRIVREKIVQVARPIYTEKIVEVPEIEYVEKIIEVPEYITQEKIIEVPRIEYQEKIVEIPHVVYQEKIVEVPEIEYREVPVEKIVEVPEIHEQIVLKEIPVPQYIDKPVPETVDVEEIQEHDRLFPIPVENVTTVEFKLPQIRPTYKKVEVPLYVPRFIEVAVPMDLMDAATKHSAEMYSQHLATWAAQEAGSLCELEQLASSVKQADFASKIANADLKTTVLDAWRAGTFKIDISNNIVHSKVPFFSETTTTTTTTVQSGGVSVPLGSVVGGLVPNIGVTAEVEPQATQV